MGELDAIRNLLKSIIRLSGNDQDIAGLAAHGLSIADSTHNRLDVVRECALAAGLLNELVAESQPRNAHKPEPQSNVESKQLAVLLSEIGNEAYILEQLLLEHSQEANNDRFHATITVTQKIGYLADKGANMPGGIASKGGAENWFLPPSYHWASESLAGTEA